jgi:hypothetical protein
MNMKMLALFFFVGKENQSSTLNFNCLYIYIHIFKWVVWRGLKVVESIFWFFKLGNENKDSLVMHNPRT